MPEADDPPAACSRATPASRVCRHARGLAASVLAVLAAGCLSSPAPGRAETLTLADCLRETAAHNPDIIAAAIRHPTGDRRRA